MANLPNAADLRAKFRGMVATTKRFIVPEPPEADPVEEHAKALEEFANSCINPEAFLRELDARIEVAKVSQRESRQSHPDMCHYDGMEEAIETLKNDFLAWREQE